MKKSLLLRGALSLATGTLIVKILGIFYRIPLTIVLGSKGLGVYQMIFPVYALLLDFSGAGMPSAISKAISCAQDDTMRVAKGYLKSSLKILSIVGAIGMVLMATLSYPLALLQGNKSAFLGYLFLSPAVLIVAIMSCYRGYFQGLMQMNPTSVSQVIEQTVKLFFSLFLAYLFMPNISFAVAGATFGVTISEGVSLIYLYMVYRKQDKKLLVKVNESPTDKKMIKTLIRIAIPVTVVGLMIPLSHFIDSFLVVNILKGYRTDATSLYGISSGAVHTVIGLPVGLCYAFAVISLPSVSRTPEIEKRKYKINESILVTGVVALLGTVICYLFAKPIINVLFNSFSFGEKKIAVSLLRLTSPCILLLSVLQTTNSALVAIDKPFLPVVSLGIGVLIKTVLSIILIKIPLINIYGTAFALIACYFFAVMINFIMLLSQGTKNAGKTINPIGRKT
jgi:stage V sporulation protein B